MKSRIQSNKHMHNSTSRLFTNTIDGNRFSTIFLDKDKMPVLAWIGWHDKYSCLCSFNTRHTLLLDFRREHFYFYSFILKSSQEKNPKVCNICLHIINILSLHVKSIFINPEPGVDMASLTVPTVQLDET